MNRTLRKFVLAAVLLVTPLALVAARPTEPELVLPTAPVIGGPDFSWRFLIKIRNRLEFGLYVDSLWAEVDDLDAGVTGNPKRTTLPLNVLRMTDPSISSGESLSFTYGGSALAEQARVTILMASHSGDGRRFRQSGTVEMRPSQQSRQLPSEIVQVEGRAIELVRIVGADGTEEPGSGVLLLHGHGTHARRLLPVALDIARQGYSVVLMSLPGYGRSAGPVEFAGPVTLAAIDAALDTLAAMRGVDPGRLAIWGAGHGATAAALAAARRPTLGALVLSGGLYDLEAVLAHTRSGPVRDLVAADAGKTAAARRARAPLEQASALRMPVLLMHATQDSVAPLAQAQAYESALRSNGTRVQLVTEPGTAAVMSFDLRQDAVVGFLRQSILLPPASGHGAR